MTFEECKKVIDLYMESVSKESDMFFVRKVMDMVDAPKEEPFMNPPEKPVATIKGVNAKPAKGTIYAKDEPKEIYCTGCLRRTICDHESKNDPAMTFCSDRKIPKGVNAKPVKTEKKPVVKHYKPKKCIKCGKEFIPRSGKTLTCDICKDIQRTSKELLDLDPRENAINDMKKEYDGPTGFVC